MEIRLIRHNRHVAIVTVDNQPRLNAMTRKMLSELGRLWDELERDRDCRCIILTGAGERAFTVGADVSGDLSAGPETARMVNHALLKNDAYSKPIVAAVNGDCVGGGLELIPALLMTLGVVNESRHYTIEHGHTSIGYYAALSALGFLPEDRVVDKFRRSLDIAGHVSWVPGGTELSSGRLGVMVPVATGLA